MGSPLHMCLGFTLGVQYNLVCPVPVMEMKLKGCVSDNPTDSKTTQGQQWKVSDSSLRQSKLSNCGSQLMLCGPRRPVPHSL